MSTSHVGGNGKSHTAGVATGTPTATCCARRRWPGTALWDSTTARGIALCTRCQFPYDFFWALTFASLPSLPHRIGCCTTTIPHIGSDVVRNSTSPPEGLSGSGPRRATCLTAQCASLPQCKPGLSDVKEVGGAVGDSGVVVSGKSIGEVRQHYAEAIPGGFVARWAIADPTAETWFETVGFAGMRTRVIAEHCNLLCAALRACQGPGLGVRQSHLASIDPCDVTCKLSQQNNVVWFEPSHAGWRLLPCPC